MSDPEKAIAELDKLHAELEQFFRRQLRDPMFDDLYKRIGSIIAAAKAEIEPAPAPKLHGYIITVQIFASGGEQIHVEAATETEADNKAIEIAQKMFDDGTVVLDLQEVTIQERWRA